MNNNNNKKPLYWAIAGFVVVVVLMLPDFFPSSSKLGKEYVPASKMLEYVEQGKVESIVVYDQDAKFKLTGSTEWQYVILPQNYSQMVIFNMIKDTNADVKFTYIGGGGGFAVISWILSVFLPIAIIVYMIYKMRSGGGISNFIHGESKFKEASGKAQTPKDRFADIAGVNEAVEEISELVEYLKNPARFKKMGARIPKGCLFCGPPGTGKTLLARCVAGEAGVPFFATSGSEFTEIFVGLGAKRVRELFANARKNAPCIIFIDEIDAIGRRRGKESPVGGNDERESTLNQLLVEMDGFNVNSGTIVIAATNIPDVLDSALLRPGRFDRKIYINLPDIQGRVEILNVSIRKGNVKLAPNIDIRSVARATSGFSGADLDNLINEAAIVAAKANKLRIGQDDINYARDKITMGSERRSMVITPETNRITAYHEAGHAILSMELPNADPLCKVSIVPRGMAMGVTLSMPENDKYFHKKSELLSRVVVIMGGRAAELIIFGDDDFTSGASNDFLQGTNIAYAMVTELGMSDTIGPVRFVKEDSQFMPRYSEHTAQIIDKEVKQILNDGMSDALRILKANIEKLHLLAKALLEYETLDSKEVEELFKTGNMDFKTVTNTESSSGDSVIPDFEDV